MDLTPQQLFGWRRDARRQAEEPTTVAAFAPVVVEPDAVMPTAGPELYLIEVVIGAVTVRIPRGVDSTTLETVVRAIKALAPTMVGTLTSDQCFNVGTVCTKP